MKSLLEKGFRIPEDMAVAGFDDTQLAAAVIPALTSVSQNSMELGRNALQILSKLIQKLQVEKQTVLEPELVVRKSTNTRHAYFGG